MKYLTLLALFLAGCNYVTVQDPKLSQRDARLVAEAPQWKHENPDFQKVIVPFKSTEKVGTIIIDRQTNFLYQVRPNGEAIRYPVSVGSEAFDWSGETIVQRKAEWPSWTPPAEMLARWPHLPSFFAGGPKNPLGARGIYLYANGRDTLYRIHGTNEPENIGFAVSSGCIRMMNIDVIHLYENTPNGTKVIVR